MIAGGEQAIVHFTITPSRFFSNTLAHLPQDIKGWTMPKLPNRIYSNADLAISDYKINFV